MVVSLAASNYPARMRKGSSNRFCLSSVVCRLSSVVCLSLAQKSPDREI